MGARQAVLVDPDRSVARYLRAADDLSLHVVGLFETHLHADFLTGSIEARAATGATIFIPADASPAFTHRGLKPGEFVRVGEVAVEAIASPGHTPEHLSYAFHGEGPPVLFSGGSLIVGGAARTDLIHPSMTEALTRAQHRTLREAFRNLADDTILLPTHGGGSFCSTGDGRTRTSTLGEERRTNALLRIEDESEFAAWFPTTFPAVQLAREAGTRGGTTPAVFNAANEEAVAAFVAGRVPFLGIVDTVAQVVTEHDSTPTPTVDDVLAAEDWARKRAQEVLA